MVTMVFALQTQHVERYFIDPSNIPIQRHNQRAETDRLHAIRPVTRLRTRRLG
jgi:transposase